MVVETLEGHRSHAFVLLSQYTLTDKITAFIRLLSPYSEIPFQLCAWTELDLKLGKHV